MSRVAAKLCNSLSCGPSPAMVKVALGKMRPNSAKARKEVGRPFLGINLQAWTQRQAKLWTRIGMGECQGAVCGPACAALFGWDANAGRPPLGAPRCGGWSAAIADAGEV